MSCEGSNIHAQSTCVLEVHCVLEPKAFVLIEMPWLIGVVGASAPSCRETGVDRVICLKVLAGLSCRSWSTVTASSAWGTMLRNVVVQTLINCSLPVNNSGSRVMFWLLHKTESFPKEGKVLSKS